MGNSYRDLEVWQLAVDFVTAVYSITRQFPQDERFGLTAQVRRAAVSVPSNIAEGQGRGTAKDFRHFLALSRGSLMELETQLIIASNLGYIETNSLEDLLRITSRLKQMLYRLMESLGDQREASATAGK